ncbi:MAG: hypothetical protein ACLFRZ_10985 [Rhodosalinus sp.]
MWREGVSLSEIAHRCGVSGPAVSKGARLAGLPPRRGGRPRRACYDGEAFRKAWLADMKVEAMAAALGVSPCTVWNAARLRGLPPKHHMRAAQKQAAE